MITNHNESSDSAIPNKAVIDVKSSSSGWSDGEPVVSQKVIKVPNNIDRGASERMKQNLKLKLS